MIALLLWWWFTIVHSHNLIHIMLSCFIGVSMLQYSKNIRAGPGTVQRLEEDVEKAFPEEGSRLEWFRMKVAELEFNTSKEIAKF